MKVNSKMEKEMDSEKIYGQTVKYAKEFGKKTLLMVKEY
jgi:hypothetical protein